MLCYPNRETIRVATTITIVDEGKKFNFTHSTH